MTWYARLFRWALRKCGFVVWTRKEYRELREATEDVVRVIGQKDFPKRAQRRRPWLHLKPILGNWLGTIYNHQPRGF